MTPQTAYFYPGIVELVDNPISSTYFLYSTEITVEETEKLYDLAELKALINETHIVTELLNLGFQA